MLTFKSLQFNIEAKLFAGLSQNDAIIRTTLTLFSLQFHFQANFYVENPMSDFDPETFAFGALAGIETVIALVAASAVSPADLIDRQRLIDHAVMEAKLARARSALARDQAQAARESIEASAALRLAAAQCRE
jgi:hypothetical protein